MQRERYTRRTYGGHNGPRRPAYPGLLRGRRPPILGLRLPRLAGSLLIVIALGVLAISLVLFGTAYSLYAGTAASLKPRLAALEDRQLFESSRIFDRNGELLYEFFDAGRRTSVGINQIAPLVISATVAVEDQSFFTNTGVDPSGIARTLFSSLQAGEETGGASTITQQVIKNSVLTNEERSPEQRYERKLKEIILAQELDKLLTKDEILELYLNENFYGNLAYGIEAASETYFGVSASELNLNQASLLAGLPQLPSVYNPINYLERDQQGGYLPGVILGENWLDAEIPLPETISTPRWRQIAVLRRMVDDGHIEEAEARSAIAEPLRFAAQEVPLNAPHFVFYVRDLIQERYGQEVLFGGGLRITTTLDLNMQRMVQQKAYEHISELQERNIHNASVVVMQPNTGQVLAMVGSIDYNAVVATTSPGEAGNVLDGQVNVATRERQPGSALKPFTYLAAMEKGMTPETVLWDVPTDFPVSASGSGAWYTPLNYNGRFNGPVRIRTALANSLNIPAVKALKFAGIDQTLGLLNRVGIKQGLQRGRDFYGLSLTLGGGEVTPLELTTAYNTLASGGRYYAPVPILRITNAEGRTIEEFLPQRGQQVVDEGIVAIISDMLSDDRARQPVWGLNSPLKLSLPAAVKTGTTNDWRDAWAAGYTPFVTVGVWTGNNNNEPTEQVESLTGGGVIWRNVMEELFVWIREDPQYRTLFAAPFADGVIPTEFKLPEDKLEKRAICALPGSYGGYNQELFTRPMLSAILSGTPTSGTPGPTDSPTPTGDPDEVRNIPCTAYSRVTVVRIPNAAEWSSDGQIVLNNPAEGQAPQRAAYCRPEAGSNYPPSLVRTIYNWKTPPPDPDMRVRYEWQGGDAGSNIRVNSLPACSADMFDPPRPQPPVAGAIQMPDLQRLGENQAKVLLSSLGVQAGSIYVDYQDRVRLGAIFDEFAAYSVVSTQPAAGDWIVPGTAVILGIRAPDANSAPEPSPVPPSDPPPTPTAPPPSDPIPTPSDPPPSDPIPTPSDPLPSDPRPAPDVTIVPLPNPAPPPTNDPPPEATTQPDGG